MSNHLDPIEQVGKGSFNHASDLGVASFQQSWLVHLASLIALVAVGNLVLGVILARRVAYFLSLPTPSIDPTNQMYTLYVNPILTPFYINILLVVLISEYFYFVSRPARHKTFDEGRFTVERVGFIASPLVRFVFTLISVFLFLFIFNEWFRFMLLGSPSLSFRINCSALWILWFLYHTVIVSYERGGTTRFKQYKTRRSISGLYLASTSRKQTVSDLQLRIAGAVLMIGIFWYQYQYILDHTYESAFYILARQSDFSRIVTFRTSGSNTTESYVLLLDQDGYFYVTKELARPKIPPSVSIIPKSDLTDIQIRSGKPLNPPSRRTTSGPTATPQPVIPKTQPQPLPTAASP